MGFGQVFIASQPSPNTTKEQAFLKGNRLLPFLIALILLAFALGSLSRSRAGGPSLLSNSYWLIYLVDLLPIIGLGLIVAMLAIMIYYWRALSDSIGYGIARKRRQGKKKRGVEVIVWMATWAIAIVVLLEKCGGLLCKTTSQTSDLPQTVANTVSGTGPIPTLPLLDAVVRVDALIQANWFYAAFVGFLVVSAAIIVRGVKVSLDEIRAQPIVPIQTVPEEGRAAVRDAIKIIEAGDEQDPRTKIINCYQRMVGAAQHLGVIVTSNLTARELQRAIREMLLLKGSAINDLTKLFEEARYSKHEITSSDAESAHAYLLSIADEMKIPVSVLN